MVVHDFYCINCGRRGIPLPRKIGHQHGKYHRKSLYCPYCKMTLNHIEVRTEDERIEFLENFEKGLYKDEAEESISVVRMSSIR